jgi:amidase
MDDLIFASTARLAQAIRSKSVSSSEAVDAYLRRIDEVNPRLNAVVHITADSARQQGQEADAALARDEIHGPLHGVPMTIKDSLDTAGVISTAGTTGRACFVPEQDATVVARLRGAGAILLGKTNTPELTLSFETDNAVYGRTNNPYDLSFTPGGSSGGAAAIIAAGGSPLDVGSDLAGSIRLPSHFCGIAGLKPTSGRVPRTGHTPPHGMGALDGFQTLGPMARYVEDLALVLPIIAGVDWHDPAIIPMPLDDPTAVSLEHLRVAYHTDNGLAPSTPETANVVRRAAKALGGVVLALEEARPSGIEQTLEIMGSLWGADGGAWRQRLLHRAGTAESSELPENTDQMLVAQFTGLLEKLDQFRSGMLAFLKDYDVIICPVNACPAMPHTTTGANFPAFSYTITYNLTGWPVVVVRGGTSPDGLPIGVQVVARPWREDIALSVALFLESVLGGWQRPPL